MYIYNEYELQFVLLYSEQTLLHSIKIILKK
jgi:hypothetical protein